MMMASCPTNHCTRIIRETICLNGYSVCMWQACNQLCFTATIAATTAATVAPLLQVLGRSEFKQLLRWRLGLRRDLKSLLGGGAAADEDGKKGSHKKQQQQQEGEGDEEGEGGEQEDAEQKLLAEMEAIKDAAEKR